MLDESQKPHYVLLGMHGYYLEDHETPYPGALVLVDSKTLLALSEILGLELFEEVDGGLCAVNGQKMVAMDESIFIDVHDMRLRQLPTRGLGGGGTIVLLIVWAVRPCMYGCHGWTMGDGEL